MYITSSTSYRQILPTLLKVIGIVSIFVAPIALLQVISASKQNDIKRANQDGSLHKLFDSHIREPDLQSSLARPNIGGQLGELFDVSPRKDSKSAILRLKRQTEDGSRAATLAQLTVAGTNAGMILGDQVAAAQMAQAEANNDQEPDEDEESKAAVDLSSQQSLGQPAPPGGYAPDQLSQNQRQADDINPDQMPDSMDSLMRSEQDDIGADQVDNEQPSASSQLVGDQQILAGSDGDDDDENEPNNQESPSLAAANLPTSYLSLQAPSSGIAQGIANDFNGPIYAKELGSPMIDSSEDLSAAAGHHHKKKKKKVKKIVIKKKKKSKKHKKLKKIKIIKYKKKKMVKAKKPMKHHHHHDHGKYYMYAKVPKKKSWEFGFKKGNKKHWIERHEKGHKSKFKTKVKWFDKKSKGKGVHIWDYNHHDKKKKKHYK